MAQQMRCHYCGHTERIKKRCSQCRGEYLEQIGLGTQRVETEILAAFPGARVGRIDRDTVRRRGALGALLRKFGQGELDVLVGTQMIAKGHDFPNLSDAEVTNRLSNLSSTACVLGSDLVP